MLSCISGIVVSIKLVCKVMKNDIAKKDLQRKKLSTQAGLFKLSRIFVTTNMKNRLLYQTLFLKLK